MDMRHRFAWPVALALILLSGCAAGKTGTGRDGDAATALNLVAQAEKELGKRLDGPGGDVLGSLLPDASGVMIIPSAGEFGFLLTLGGGNALLMARTESGWTGPVVMGRGSLGFGWQAGVYSRSGVFVYMHEKDVRYVMETGAIFQGNVDLVIFNRDEEYDRTPEFRESGEIYYLGDKSGLFAGVAFDAGGYSDRPALNRALTGVPDGDPEAVLYGVRAMPEAAAGLRALILGAGAPSAKEKDGTEVPSP